MSWHPIKEGCASPALDTVAWSVVLNEPLVQSHQTAIRDADDAIKELLPVSECGHQFQVRLDASGRPTGVGESVAPEYPAALKYARYDETGNIALGLDINGPALTVANQNYDSWSNAKVEVLNLFALVARGLRDAPPVSLRALELNYRGMFWWEGEWFAGAIADLCNREDARLIPDWLFEAKSIWHNDAGEEVIRDDERFVERLAVHCIDSHVAGKPRRMVVMDTTTRWLEKDNPNGATHLHSAFADGGVGARRFETMHDFAKMMFQRVIRPDIRGRLSV